MNSTELCMAVTCPNGKPATHNQLLNARKRKMLDEPDSGYGPRHVEQLQAYVNSVAMGRPKGGGA